MAISGGAFKISATTTRVLAWVDAHYQVNGGQLLNVRMQPESGRFEAPVTLHAGDTMTYWLTYSPGAYVLETAPATFTAPGTFFIVDKTADGSGTCAANGGSGGDCNLRAAFAAAETAAQPVSIMLNVPPSITLGEIDISGAAPGYDVSVQSNGNVQTISGGGTSRLLWLSSGSLTLRDLAINGFSGYDGGAIVNRGQLVLSGVSLSNNTASCFDVGAMTAFITCNGGAVANYGSLTVRGGTQFINNSVTAQASTASYTNANASGGAIVSSGTLLFDGPFSFAGNFAKAAANSGFHSSPGGASAGSAGGAIANVNGSVTVSGAAIGHCSFQANSALATASAPSPYSATASSAGGALTSVGGTVTIPAGACSFIDNNAIIDPDLHILP